MNVLIIAGGKGERFWPKSTISKPKQLLPIVTDKPMIEETVNRLLGLVDYKNIFISTNKNLIESINEILPGIPEENYIIEPVGRDTGPAIGLGAVYIGKREPGSVMVVLPADHLITEKDIFQNDLQIAEQIAKNTGCLITFGIKPSRIETGYGYIELGEVINAEYENHAYEVRKFEEKPDLPTAKQYYEQGNYVWNSGMFIWTTNAILEAFEKHLPNMFEDFMEIQENIGTDRENEVVNEYFENFEKISIDYGIMEKADNVLCVKARFTWDDVGAWSALSRVKSMDEDNNLIQSDWKGIDTRNCIIVNDKGIISTIGINNLIVIKHGDSLLITEKTREQEVKKIVNELKKDEEMNKYIM